MPSKDKAKIAKSQKKWYESHKEAMLARNKKARHAAQAFIQESKRGKKCSFCEENDPACLDFHHKDPAHKELCVAETVRAGWSIQRIQQEIDKCELICANCHRKITYRNLPR